MNITNKYCLLSGLSQTQIDKLKELMPYTKYFDFLPPENLIGFDLEGDAGTWSLNSSARERGTIPYKEMLFLLGVKEEEELVPHVHQKEIIAWANGGEIEVESPFLENNWVLARNPLWAKGSQYRVKESLSSTQLIIAEKEKELSLLKYQDAVERGVNIVLGEVDES